MSKLLNGKTQNPTKSEFPTYLQQFQYSIVQGFVLSEKSNRQGLIQGTQKAFASQFTTHHISL